MIPLFVGAVPGRYRPSEGSDLVPPILAASYIDMTVKLRPLDENEHIITGSYRLLLEL